MWAIVSWLWSGLVGLVTWAFRISTWKFVIFGVLALILGPLMSLLMGLIDAVGLDSISSLVGALPDGLRYYLVVFKVEVGIPMLIAAMLTKFFIRRLPVVG